MINEFIEKEMEKLGEHRFSVDKYKQIEACCLCHNLSRKKLTKDFAQTIAKEVAMRFKEELKINWTIDYMAGYNECLEDKNALADQIINEVSE